MYQWKIALRSLLYRKSQYVSLFLVCLFGVAISLGAIAVSTGMIFSLNQKARIYYGGEIALMCSEGHGLAINNYQEKYEIVKSFFDDDAVVVPRLDFDARHSSFYFEGVQALQQTIKGVNFEAERALLSTFNFVEGGLDAVTEKNAVFISAPIAKMLGCVLGDEITFQLQTVEGNLVIYVFRESFAVQLDRHGRLLGSPVIVQFVTFQFAGHRARHLPGLKRVRHVHVVHGF